MEARGKWMNVNQGHARVPSFKGFGNTAVVLRVPFRKNGGGFALNQYTITMQVRFADLCHRGLLCTAGWDQWSKPAEGDDNAQLYLDGDGGLGAHGAFGDASSPRVTARAWHTLTCAVDCVGGAVRTYVDGREVAECRSAKVCKDGQHALKGRVALFFERQRSTNVDYYLRSVTVHNRVLDGEQARKEHEMLEALLLEDAIAAAPSYLQPPLAERHSLLPFADTRELRKRSKEIKRSSCEVAEKLWHALLASDTKHVSQLADELEPHELAVCARWKRRDLATDLVQEVDEATPPFGETLLHAAAFAGHVGLLGQLLGAGARVSRTGQQSCCTALHAAAAGGNLDACERLLAAGCRVGALSAGKRSALYIACLKGFHDVARALVAAGADPYASPSGGEAVMSLLRRLGGPAAALIPIFDEVSRAAAATKEAAAAAAPAAAAPAAADPDTAAATAPRLPMLADDDDDDDDEDASKEGEGEGEEADSDAEDERAMKEYEEEEEILVASEAESESGDDDLGDQDEDDSEYDGEEDYDEDEDEEE